MKFSKEFLLEEVLDSEKVVKHEIVGKRRWSVDYWAVFKHEGKFYGTSVGATERQDESPYEYAPDEIECPEVFPVHQLVIEYKTAEEIAAAQNIEEIPKSVQGV